MFKFALAIATALVPGLASAKNLTVQEFRDRLELRADIYVVDDSGKHIVSGPERTNYWRPHLEDGKIGGDWSSKFPTGLIALRHHWDVGADGTLKVSIEEYAKNSEKDQFEELLQKKDYVVENFEPIVWKVNNIKSEHFIARFIPSLREISTPISVENLPIAGTGVSISDNAGYLWADGLQFSGKYSGVTSHRGTLALSYLPFKGAKEMGVAEGDKITLSVDKKYEINLKSTTAFLPAGVTAKVYAVYLPEKKSKGFNSIHSFDTSREERIQEVLKK